ncbi:hypothetical protein D3C72_710630 [compost metagenome]
MVDGVVAAPRAVHLAMVDHLAAMFGAQALHHVLHVLHVGLVDHQHGVGGFHHHHVMHAHAGNQPAFRVGEAGRRAIEHHAAPRGVAERILGRDVPDRGPGADIGPARVQRHHAPGHVGQALQLLHHGVVDGVRLARAEGLAVQPERIAAGLTSLASLVGGAALHVHLGLELAHRAQPHRRTHHEDAAVPPVAAGFHVVPGQLQVRLLDEFLQRVGAIDRRAAGADVAVAGFRRDRHHAERDDGAGVGMAYRRGERLAKRRQVRDAVVGRRHHQHHIAPIRSRHRVQRRHGQRRGRVAAAGLGQQPRGLAGALHHVRDHEAMFLAADHQLRRLDAGRAARQHRHAVEAARGGLQQRVFRHEVQQLLGKLFARERPQARAGTPGHDHGLDRELDDGQRRSHRRREGGAERDGRQAHRNRLVHGMLSRPGRMRLSVSGGTAGRARGAAARPCR